MWAIDGVPLGWNWGLAACVRADSGPQHQIGTLVDYHFLYHSFHFFLGEKSSGMKEYRWRAVYNYPRLTASRQCRWKRAYGTIRALRISSVIECSSFEEGIA
jgi:hypothetical protein